MTSYSFLYTPCSVLALPLNHKAAAGSRLTEEPGEQPASSVSAVLTPPSTAWIRSLDTLPQGLLHTGVVYL